MAGSLDRLIKKEKITAADKEARPWHKINTTTNYDALQGAQLVIEAARENYDP